MLHTYEHTLINFCIISAAVFDTGEKELSFGNDNSDLFPGGAPVTKVTMFSRCASNRITHLYYYSPQAVQLEAKQNSQLIHCLVMKKMTILIG